MNSIKERFEVLRENYTIANAINYVDFLDECSKSEIVESFESTFVEPIKGAEFSKKFILVNSFNENELNMMKVTMENFINNAEMTFYENQSHIESVKECLNIIDCKLTDLPKSNLVDSVLESFYLSDMEITCEATTTDKTMKDIISKDIDDETKVKLANKLMKNIKTGTFPLNVANGINLIVSATTVTLYYAATLPITVVTTLLPIPVIVVSKLINDGLKAGNIAICKRVLEAELKKIEAAQRASNVSQDTETYRQNIIQAINMLDNDKYISLESTLSTLTEVESVHEQLNILDNAITENFVKFSLSEDETVEESIEWFNNIVKLSNVKELVVKEGLFSKSRDITQESSDECEFEDDDCMDDLFDAIDDEIEDIFDDLEEQEEYVEEGSRSDEARKKVNVAANKIKTKAHKLKDKVKKTGQVGKAAVHQVGKAGKALDDAATNTVNKAKGTYRNDIREEIVEDKTRIKLFRIIRKSIGIGVATAVNPALGAITALTSYALGNKVKEKERRRILNELNEELEIVNEKIDDARGDSNKEKKYQLMRIRNQLQRDIKRIQFRIKSDGKGV